MLQKRPALWNAPLGPGLAGFHGAGGVIFFPALGCEPIRARAGEPPVNKLV
ncbi:hypothetical protein LQ318_14070 [Aliifodinibius salicampi]|uniref:Uncharacterized protein n=1 Tax=Fodinibius salicampi TaxID=1920655 RepID=A0ABT3Q1Q3_9BACT|nr:hypothetical protein [Fodinibius salicampi]MCW9714034.1 hypothetical protein [Fodinibius salicampi]